MPDLFKLLLSAVESSIDSGVIDPNSLNLSGYAHLGNYVAGLASGIGLALLTVYFLVDLNLKMATEGMSQSLKTMMASLIKFIALALFVGNGATITNYVIDFANSLITNASGAGNGATVNGALGAEFSNAINATLAATNQNFFVQIFGGLVLLIMWLVNFVVGLIWMYKAMLFKFEFVFRIGLYPFAFADAYNGTSSGAFRYIKSLIAMGLYGAAFILVPKLGIDIVITDVQSKLHSMSIVTAWDAFGMLLMFSIVPIAQIGALGLCKQAAKEALA